MQQEHETSGGARAEARPGTPPRVWSVLAVYCGVLAWLLLAAIVMAGVWMVIGSARRPGAAWETEPVASPGLVLASASVSSLTLMLVAVAAASLSREPTAKRLRVGPGAATAGATVAVVLGFFALSQALDSGFALAGWELGGAIAFMASAVAQAQGPVLGLLVLVMGPMAGMGEELFFRGYMQTRLSARWGSWKAVLVTAAAFGLLHLDPVHSPLAFLSGLFLGWTVELTGSILPAIAAHVVNNTLWVGLAVLLPEGVSRAVHGWLLGVFVLVGLACIARLLRSYPGTERVKGPSRP